MAYTKQQIIAALDKTGGMVYMAAEVLGCTHNTILNWIKRSPDVAAVQDKWRGKLLDFAERKLYDKVSDGDNWAIGFALGKLGHGRGYKDKQEVDVKGDVTVEIKWVEDDTDYNDQAAEDAPQAGGDLSPSGTV
jgi:hypothetical protein